MEIGAADEGRTSGYLLGGRVYYAQPRRGFRSGIEPLLLAAAVPALPGERVLEGGCGAGATLLCLAARVPGVRGIGVEQSEALVDLAGSNAAANGLRDLSFVAGDVAALPEQGLVDHACANPPYHLTAGTRPPDPSRRAAKHGQMGLLAVWATALTRHLRSRGTVTFILASASVPAAVTAFAVARCGPTALLPLWPKPGRAAKLVLLQGVKDGRSPFHVLPGITLHRADGHFTPEADAILRDGQGLRLSA